MNLASLQISTNRLLNDQARAFLTLGDGTRFANDAVREVQKHLKVARTTASFSSVANQYEYDLPELIATPELGGVVINPGQDNFRPAYDDMPSMSGTIMGTSDLPESYTLRERSDKLQFLYAFASSAPHTHVATGHAVAAADQTIYVDDVSEFPEWGRAAIEDEVISWTGQNTTLNTLTGVIRGMEATIPAAHAEGATVTLRNVWVHGVRRIRTWEMRTYYATGTASITYGATALTSAGCTWNAGQVIPGDEFGSAASWSSTQDLESDPQIWVPISIVTGANAATLARKWYAPTVASQSYVISSPNPLPEDCDQAVKYWMAMLGAAREKDSGFMDRFAMLFDKEIKVLSQRYCKNQRRLIPQGYRDGGSSDVTAGLTSAWLPRPDVGAFP